MIRLGATLQRLSISFQLMGVIAVFSTTAFAAPATKLKVCINKKTGAVVAKSACSNSEIVFSEKAYSPGRDRIVHVAKTGAKYKSIDKALSDVPLLRPSASSPVVIRIGPGTFTIGTGVILPSYVTLEGSGPEATIIKTNPMAGLVLQSNTSLRRLSVQSTFTRDGLIVVHTDVAASHVTVEDVAISLSGSFSNQTALSLTGSNFVAKRIRVNSPTNSAGGIGLSIRASSVLIDDVDITIYGAGIGLSIIESPNLTVRNLRTTLRALQTGQVPTGILIGEASTIFYGEGMNVVVDGTATSNSAAVYMSGSVGEITVTNSVFDVTGPTSAAFLVEDGGTASISNSKISASGTGAPLGATLNSAIKVAGTLLSGGPVFVASGSTITCAGVHDENFSFFSSSCP